MKIKRQHTLGIEEAKRRVDLVAEELNIKEVEPVDDLLAVARFEAKPNFGELGPRFGKQAIALHLLEGGSDGFLRQRLEFEHDCSFSPIDERRP